MEVDGHDLTVSKNKVKNIGKSHTGNRVAGDGAIYAALYAEEEIRELFSLAAELAEHADRKTIMEQDVRKAAKIMEDY